MIRPQQHHDSIVAHPQTQQKSCDLPPSSNSSIVIPIATTSTTTSTSNSGVPFPIKLHHMLNAVESEGRSDAIAWTPDGKGFTVHKPKDFAASIMPKYFNQTKYKSFQRQLNLYKFDRRPCGKVNGIYYHALFTRDNIEPCFWMRRTKRRVLPKKPRNNASINPAETRSQTIPSTMAASTPTSIVGGRSTNNNTVLGGTSQSPPSSFNQGSFLGFHGAMNGSSSVSIEAATMISVESTTPQHFVDHHHANNNDFYAGQNALGKPALLSQPYTQSSTPLYKLANMTRVAPSMSSHRWQQNEPSGSCFGVPFQGDEPNFANLPLQAGQGQWSEEPLPMNDRPIVTGNSESLADFLGRMNANTSTSAESLLEMTRNGMDDDSIESVDYIDVNCLDNVGPVTDWED